MHAHIRNEHWIATATGGVFHLQDPCPSEVKIQDIAESLSKIARYGGQTPFFYSVAQHSVMVMRNLPRDAQPYGLLHDAHEAYIGDMTRPVSRMIKQKTGRDPLAKMRKDLDKVILKALGIETPHPQIKRLVDEADDRAIATEKRDILCGHDWDWNKAGSATKIPDPFKSAIKPWPHERARAEFLEAYANLTILFPAMAKATRKTH